MKQNKMQIPEGYKNSALGIIPNDWEVKRLGEVARITSGSTPLRSTISYFKNGNIPWVKTTDLNNGYISKSEELITEKALKETSVKILSKGTVLVAMYGGFNQIGRTGLLKIDAAINQALSALIVNISILDSFFVLNWLNSKVGLWKNFAASSRKDPNITSKDVGAFPILLPPLSQQQKISEILGTWDEAIEKQSKLIDKLTDRKRGLMQQLLTGKKRLAGFSEEWKEVRLGEICKIKKGVQVNKNSLDTIGLYPTINGGLNPSGFSNNYNTVENTITISEGGNSCGYVNLIRTKFWCGGHCYAIKIMPIIANYFLYQLLKFNEKEIMNLRVGSGLPNIQIQPLYNLLLNIPSFPEQTIIADILIAADKEIELAKSKLELLRSQKNGLMQELLTGKTRVTID